jgi:DNA-binding NarL/FixJ family response regulator
VTARTDLVGVIEAAYRLDLPDDEWLGNLVVAAGPHFDRGKGVYGFCFDASKAEEFRLWATLDDEAMRRFCRKIGIVDQLTLRGVDPTFQGVAVCTPLGDVAKVTARDTGLWTRIAAHISAGFRLRRYLADSARAEGPSEPTALADAVCEADGRVVHATNDATSEEARSSLRDAIVAIDRARSDLRRQDTDEAVEVWRGLVSGTWTVVEHFDSDGRRYVLALKNTPGTQDPKTLTERERQAVHYAVLGHSTKETAYALGMSDHTVGVHLWSAMKKLGVKSRVELIRLMSPGT